MPSQTTNNKPKPVIQKIELSTEELELVDKLQNGLPIPMVRTITTKTGKIYEINFGRQAPSIRERNRRLRQIYGEACCLCNELPAYNVTYDYDGVILVERYCHIHFKQSEFV